MKDKTITGQTKANVENNEKKNSSTSDMGAATVVGAVAGGVAGATSSISSKAANTVLHEIEDAKVVEPEQTEEQAPKQTEELAPISVPQNSDLAGDVHPVDIQQDDNIHSISDTPANGNDDGIQVVGVEHGVDFAGQDADVAAINVDGHQGVLVDLGRDGIVDGAIIDFNDDGQVQQEEISPDLSAENIQMPQMSDGDMYLTQNDDMPDYTNDEMI